MGNGAISMTKKKNDSGAGEQIDLIDWKPKNAKEITKAAVEYKRIVSERQALTAEEVKAKAAIIKAVKESGARPDADGVITFQLEDIKIVIKPRDELVRVKLATDEEAGNE